MTLLSVKAFASGFELYYRGMPLIRHSSKSPCISIGHGAMQVRSRGGFFQIDDQETWSTPLRFAKVAGDQIYLSAAENSPHLITLILNSDHIQVECANAEINRFRLAILANVDEQIWGGGEQFSHLNLRGKRFPLWVAEPGIGRDPTSDLAQKLAHVPGAAGDYWTTYYPQPTYMSSRRYALHLPISAYCAFDFSNPDTHILECNSVPPRVELFGGNSFLDIVSELSTRFGRQPQLPDWAIEGAVIGLKDGHASFERLERIQDAGVISTGLWCEDWAGIRQTDFGRRLFWDWRINHDRFPDLENEIEKLESSGVQFLAYINPYLATDGKLFDYANEKGYLVRHPDTGEAYVTDFGGFDCGHIDLTNPAAAHWVSDELIGAEMLDKGITGWMADFAEYLPVDAVLHNQQDAALAHNLWPVLWAEINARAISSRGMTGKAVFFMRSGYTGVGRHCPLLWAGDQSVDFSRHDGIETTIRAALSTGLVGNAYHHSDIAGYTSLFGNVRTPGLQKRWAELAAFTPFMRTHEGNRPAENIQIDSSEGLLSHFARMTQIHAKLAPYTRALCQQAEQSGWPLQRPLFLHFPEDPVCREIETQYLYGSDLLVAPVLEEETDRWTVYLPEGETWIHVWSGIKFVGGEWVDIDAPFGEPPVFFRNASAHKSTFEAMNV